MHPMFVRLFIETDTDDLLAEEQDRKRRARSQARQAGPGREGRRRYPRSPAPPLTYEPTITGGGVSLAYASCLQRGRCNRIREREHSAGGTTPRALQGTHWSLFLRSCYLSAAQSGRRILAKWRQCGWRAERPDAGQRAARSRQPAAARAGRPGGEVAEFQVTYGPCTRPVWRCCWMWSTTTLARATSMARRCATWPRRCPGWPAGRRRRPWCHGH
jgi:hypothetical protein